MKILICEDDKMYRDFLKFAIKLNLNSEVLVVENGLKGIEELKKSSFDLIISDLDMGVPGGSGLDLFRYVVRNKLQLHFFLLSGNADFNLKFFVGHEKFRYFSKIHVKELMDYLVSNFVTDEEKI